MKGEESAAERVGIAGGKGEVLRYPSRRASGVPADGEPRGEWCLVFYVALILVLAVLGTWNSGTFLDWLDSRGFSLVVRSAISIAVMGLLPSLIIIVAGVFDAMWATRKQQ